MKSALQLAWQLSDDPHYRSAIESSYVLLSRFQEGVGPAPLEFDLKPEMSPTEVLGVFTPDVLERQKRSVAESLELMSEFDAFKKS
jgi:hypothetical protein